MKIKLFLFSLSVLFSFGLSAQSMHDICPLKVGSEVPDSIPITSLEGKVETLSSLIDSQATVLVFYRGGWCGYCIRQLSGLREISGQIDSLGYNLIGITPDQYSELEKSIAKAEVDYPLYSDNTAALISAFGLNWKLGDAKHEKYKSEYKIDIEAWSGEDHHILPVPAVYVIKNGIVKFHYVNPNYAERLDPDMLLAVLQTL